MDAATITNLATPVLVPLLLAGIKALKPNIPTWLLPILAAILGGVGVTLAGMALHFQTNTVAAVLLGLAGVGVREVVDQLKPTPSDPRD